MQFAGKADVQLGTLSCEPGQATITSGGRVTIDSLDGNADISAGTQSDPADATVHCHDNLRSLSLTAGDVSLRLSPSLAEKVVFSIPIGIKVPELPEGVAVRSEAEFQEQGDEFSAPVIRLNIREGAKVSVEVESWIQSLSRRTRTERS